MIATTFSTNHLASLLDTPTFLI